MNKIISFIESSHNNIVEKNTNRIATELKNGIEIINNELEYHKNKVLSELKSQLLQQQEKATTSNNRIDLIDSEIEFKTLL